MLVRPLCARTMPRGADTRLSQLLPFSHWLRAQQRRPKGCSLNWCHLHSKQRLSQVSPLWRLSP